VAPSSSLGSVVDALVQELKAKPRRAVAVGKRFFYRQLEQTVEEAYRDATSLMVENMLSDEGQEGVGAFVEKRKPAWRD
jgi:enoyl-CoA hydratase/carnithine racemase